MRQVIITILFFVTTCTVGQMAAELYLPALPYIVTHFNATPQSGELSVAFFLLGMSTMGVIFGYLSDSFGRKKILYIALIIGVIGTFICYSTSTMLLLIIGRFVQGAGYSGVGSLSKAMLRDRYRGVELAKFSSQLSMLFAFIIDLSPFIGSFFLVFFGWRSIFMMILVYSFVTILLIKRYPEQKNSVVLVKLSWKNIGKSSIETLSNTLFLSYTLMTGLTYAIMMSYLTLASFLFEKELGCSPIIFGAITFGVTFFYLAGCYLNTKLLKVLHLNHLLKLGVVVMALSTLPLWLMWQWIDLSYLGLIGYIFLMYVGCGLLYSNCSALAFQVIHKGIGGASSIYSSVQVLIGFVFTSLLALFHSSSTLPLAILSTFCVGIMIVTLKNIKREELKWKKKSH